MADILPKGCGRCMDSLVDDDAWGCYKALDAPNSMFLQAKVFGSRTYPHWSGGYYCGVPEHGYFCLCKPCCLKAGILW